jgi:hypothetical protein
LFVLHFAPKNVVASELDGERPHAPHWTRARST